MNTSAGRLGAVGLAVILSFALSSCGGEDAGDEPDGAAGEPGPVESSAAAGATDASGPSGAEGSDPSPESSPTPVAASSDGPAQNWPEPEVPDEIYEETQEGALAALEYWFEAATYLQLTGDAGPFDSMSESGCQICSRTVEQFDEVYGVEGAWHVTENSEVKDPIASSLTSDGRVSVLFTLSESPAQVYESSGELVLDHPGDELEAEAELMFERGSWLIEEVAFFPGGNE